ncbi:uncharacterized protein [Phaseolus vulgaris]|uniref:uncharacterized protein n=1 Tax=Phaseolus vulgaris TaxID=3885 RepID=UPI0035CA6CD5
MGELDKDLCLFWKSVAAANITFPTASIISFEFLKDQLEAHIDNMLGKGKLAELRAIARSHKLAASSQTVPNSVVEIAAAQGKTPPRGPTSSGVLPAPERKKLVLRRPKRKAPQVVQGEKEDDEATEDGLITKRNRVATSSPPALPTPTPPSPPAPLQLVQATPLAAAPPVVENSDPNFIENPPSASTPFISVGEGPPSTTSIAGAALGEDEGAQISPILITESPTSPPRLEAPLALQTQEGGGESQHQTPPTPLAATSSLPTSFEVTLRPFTAQLKTMAEDLPVLVSKAVKDSLKKLQEENSALKESNLMIRAEAEKLSCNLMMVEIEHSRLEDAMDAELRSTRKEASDLRQKLLKVADLEAAKKAEASRVENLEKRSGDREILLGKVEKERDNALAELAEAREEAKKIAAELAHARDEDKKAAEELARAREETEELKKQTHELEQSAAQVLTAGFDAALEQVACQYPELDLSMVSISNEVVDGKIVPSED